MAAAHRPEEFFESVAHRPLPKQAVGREGARPRIGHREEPATMPLPIYGTSSRLNNRFQIPFATLVGVVMLSGVATSAEGRAKKKSSRKPAAAKAFSLPPIQGHIGDAPGPPYRGFFPNADATGDELAFQEGVAKILCEKAEPYPGREEHFGWLARNELFQKYVYRVHGLSGHILETKSLPGGGLAMVQSPPRSRRHPPMAAGLV